MNQRISSYVGKRKVDSTGIGGVRGERAPDPVLEVGGWRVFIWPSVDDEVYQTEVANGRRQGLGLLEGNIRIHEQEVRRVSRRQRPGQCCCKESLIGYGALLFRGGAGYGDERALSP